MLYIHVFESHRRNRIGPWSFLDFFGKVKISDTPDEEPVAINMMAFFTRTAYIGMLLLEANMGSPVAARCMPARLGGESNMSRGDVEVDSVCSASDTKEEERESERWRDSCSSPRDLVIAALSIAGRSSPIMRSREDDDVSTLLIPAIVSG